AQSQATSASAVSLADGSTDSSPAGPVLKSREPIVYGSNRSILLLSTNDRDTHEPPTILHADVSRGAGRPRRDVARRPCDPGRDPLAAAEIVAHTLGPGPDPHPGGDRLLAFRPGDHPGLHRRRGTLQVRLDRHRDVQRSS